MTSQAGPESVGHARPDSSLVLPLPATHLGEPGPGSRVGLPVTLLGLILFCTIGFADAPVYVDVGHRHLSVFVLPALTLVAGVVALVSLRSPRRALVPASVAACLLAVWVLWALIGGTSKFGVVEGLVFTLAVAGFVAGSAVGGSLVRAHVLEGSVLAGVVLGNAIYAIGLVIQGPGDSYVLSARGWALLGPVGVAAGMALARRHRVAGAIVVVVQIVLVGASLSRMGLVASLLVVVLSLLGPSRRYWRTAAVVGVVVVAGFVAAVYLVQPLHGRFFRPPGYGDHGLKVGSRALDTSGRAHYWKESWDYFLQSPVVGHGLGTASQHIHKSNPEIDHPLNDYLRVMVDAGVVGIVALLAFMLWIGRGVWRRRWALSARDYGDPRGRLVATAANWLPAFALTMVTDNSLVYYWTLAPLAILLGYAFAAPLVQRTDGHGQS